MKNRIDRIIVLLAATGLGMPVGVPWLLRDAGAASPTAAARKCRAAIAGGGRAVVSAGLGTIDACHVRRDKGKFQGDCNVIPGNAEGFTRAQARSEATIGARCSAGNPVLNNYPHGVVDDVFPALKALIERSATDVQGSPDIAGDPGTRKAKSKCHKAIGKARSGVIEDILNRATRCQRKLDKKRADFGPLDPTCIASPGASLGKGRNGITKACSAITGADVGSCAALPDCVLSEATTTGQAMSEAIYKATASIEEKCGNGVVEGSEQCDDGNRDDEDACRNNCMNATCGDGVVASGLEECDDGNTVPNDGCTDCKIDGATCGAAGVDVLVPLIFDARMITNLAGLIVNVGYARAGVSIPGSADNQSVLDRCHDLTGKNLAFFVDQDTNSDGIDDNLFNLYTSTEPIAPGPFEQIRFDCTAGAFIRPTDFDCAIVNPSDPVGNPLNFSRDLLDCKVTRITSAP